MAEQYDRIQQVDRYLNIATDSEFITVLQQALDHPNTYKISLELRRDGIAIKRNEDMWTPTLRTVVSEDGGAGVS